MKLIFVIVLLIVAVVAFIAIKRKQLEKNQNTEAKFYGKQVLTEPEQVLYHRLRESVPELIVLAQVQISQIVGIKKGQGWQYWFNKISRKSADFVVCLKDFSIVTVVELDDSTHNRQDRQKADQDKDFALAKAGYSVLRIKVGNIPATDDLRTMIIEAGKQAKSLLTERDDLKQTGGTTN